MRNCCITCGNSVRCSWSKTKFCSRTCYFKNRHERARKLIKCEVCGKEFIRLILKIKEKNYCSKLCSNPINRAKYSEVSSEHRDKIRAIALDRGYGKWMKGKKGNKGVFKKGQFAKDKHPNWKGGVTPINQAARHSLEYAEWRKAVFERDNYTCQICGNRGGKLHADHIKLFSLYPELRTEISNGRTLCKGCHKEITKEQMKVFWSNQYRKLEITKYFNTK